MNRPKRPLNDLVVWSWTSFTRSEKHQVARDNFVWATQAHMGEVSFEGFSSRKVFVTRAKHCERVYVQSKRWCFHKHEKVFLLLKPNGVFVVPKPNQIKSLDLVLIHKRLHLLHMAEEIFCQKDARKVKVSLWRDMLVHKRLLCLLGWASLKVTQSLLLLKLHSAWIWSVVNCNVCLKCFCIGSAGVGANGWSESCRCSV